MLPLSLRFGNVRSFRAPSSNATTSLPLSTRDDMRFVAKRRFFSVSAKWIAAIPPLSVGAILLPADFPNKNNTLTLINRELDTPPAARQYLLRIAPLNSRICSRLWKRRRGPNARPMGTEGLGGTPAPPWPERPNHLRNGPGVARLEHVPGRPPGAGRRACVPRGPARKDRQEAVGRTRANGSVPPSIEGRGAAPAAPARPLAHQSRLEGQTLPAVFSLACFRYASRKAEGQAERA